MHRGPQENDICHFCNKGVLRPLSYFGEPDDGRLLKCDNLSSNDPRCRYAISTTLNVEHVGRPASTLSLKKLSLMTALDNYSRLANDEKLHEYLNRYPLPLAKELAEVVGLVTIYRTVFSGEKALKVIVEINKIGKAADGEDQLRDIVKKEEALISTALAFSKRLFQITKKAMTEILPASQWQPNRGTSDLANIDEIANEFDLKLPF